MRKAIWILFAVFALLWTLLAWSASGLARWTAEAIASEQTAQSARQLAQSTANAARSLTQAAAAATNKAAEGAAAVTPPTGDAATAAVQQSIEAAKNAAAAASSAAANLPPLPPWVDQWLGPEWAQWLRDQVKQSSGAAAQSAQAASAAAAATLDAAAATAAASGSVAQKATQDATQAAAEALKRSADTLAAQAGLPAGATVSNVAPWLAKAVGWLVPLVWIIWGIGLLIAFVATFVAQWVVGQFFVRASPTR